MVELLKRIFRRHEVSDVSKVIEEVNGHDFIPIRSLIGIPDVKEHLQVAMKSARIQGVPLGHILLLGPGGTGKTTIARSIGGEMGYLFHEIEGSSVSTRRQLFDSIIAFSDEAKEKNLNLLLFIDECHQLGKLQEYLYAPMDECLLKTSLRKVPISPLTLVAATTRSDLLDSRSFRSRFQYVWTLERYSEYDLAHIARLEFWRRGLRNWDVDVLREIARRSFGLPRKAVKLASQVADVYFSEKADYCSLIHARRMFEILGVDDEGLNSVHQNYLQILQSRNGKPCGAKALAAMLGRPQQEVEGPIEEELFSKGFVQTTPRGRVLTDSGHKHLACQGLL